MHCVSISASIDIYIKFRKLKTTLSYKQSCINSKKTHFVTFDSFFLESIVYYDETHKIRLQFHFILATFNTTQKLTPSSANSRF